MDDVPQLLISEELEKTEQAFYYEECNCACANSQLYLAMKSTSISEFLQCTPDLHIQNLPQAHTLLFNPLSNSGVAVLNLSAMQVWEQYTNPKSGSLDTPNYQISDLVKKMKAEHLLEVPGGEIQLHQDVPHTLSVWLHTNNMCNLKCGYCYLKKDNARMRYEVGQASIDAIIRSAIRGGYKHIKLKFAGGEPSLCMDLVFALHKYAEQCFFKAGLSFEVVLLSNGTLLDNCTIAQLKARGIKVMISLDGIGEMHNVHRRFINGKGTFAVVNQTIDKLIAQDIKPFISITISNRNVDGLAEVTRYVLERGLPFNFNFFRENDCARSSKSLLLTDERLIEALRCAFKIIEANLPSHSLLGAILDRSQFQHPHNRTCSVGRSYLVIDSQGKVAKCQMAINNSITDIYVDDPLSVVKNSNDGIQNLSVDEKEDCRDCQWRYWCAGGCPLLTYRTTGRYDVKSPYCEVYKAIYPELLRLEGLRIMKLAKVGPFA